MSLDAEIRIEYAMTNPKKPICFGVFVKGKHVGVLKLEDVVHAVDQFREDQGIYDAARMGG